ncbi:hypothetical protein AB1Y20_003296 [Prymnesium parvum]|uniref:PAS domain-containing protein n=1 Tax=Prymnesium parvum TaxID=97485 RepID=A0AB34JDA3_PRYPA
MSQTIGQLRRDVSSNMLHQQEQSLHMPADPCSEAHTKLMWLTCSEPEFLELLLSKEAIVSTWSAALSESGQLGAPIQFCAKLVALSTADGDPYRAALFDLAVRFLDCSYSMEMIEVQAKVHAEYMRILGMLSQSAFRKYICSSHCTKAIRQLHYELGGSAAVFSDGSSSAGASALAQRNANLNSLAEEASMTKRRSSWVIARRKYSSTPAYSPRNVSSGSKSNRRSSIQSLESISLLLRLHLKRVAQGTRQFHSSISFETTQVVSKLQDALDRLSVAAIVCDRNAPGLPIVTVNQAFTRLTGFEADQAVGFNCREVLQGPDTDMSAVAELAEAIREAMTCHVLLTNYRRDGSTFVNHISLSHPLRLSETTSLLVAVLQPQPAPLEKRNAIQQATGVLDALASCCLPSVPEAENKSMVSHSMLRKGVQWVRDAETVWRKAMRLKSVRVLTLQFALKEAAELEAEDSRGNLVDKEDEMNNVHLMLHSENVLSQRADYIRHAYELFAELETLKGLAGWEQKAIIADVRKRFVMPERGKKTYAALWNALRTTVYDPLAKRERDLGDKVSVEDFFHIDLEVVVAAANQAKAAKRARIQQFAGGEPSGADLTDGGTLDDTGSLGDAPAEENCDADSLIAQGDVAQDTLDEPAARPGSPSGSVNSSVNGTEDSLNDISMLQYSLLRVLCLSVMPGFLRSSQYPEVISLLRSEKGASNETVEVELEAIAAEMPSTSEEWIGVLLAALHHLPHAVIVCDMSLPSVPILGVNAAFELLTGYKLEECVGRNCRFLQGRDTDEEAVQRIRVAIRSQQPCHVTILNYRKDGEPNLPGAIPKGRQMANSPPSPG